MQIDFILLHTNIFLVKTLSMMIPGILANLLHSVELFQKHQKCKRVREGHGRERDSFVDEWCEDGFVYSVCPSYKENDVWVGYL